MSLRTNYLFITYIVTSKPKRISVAAGLVHIVILLDLKIRVSDCYQRVTILKLPVTIVVIKLRNMHS
jgi:hypothetical protein